MCIWHIFLITVRALVLMCHILVMSHTVHLPENNIGLNDVSFSAYVEINQSASPFFFFFRSLAASLPPLPLFAAAQE